MFGDRDFGTKRIMQIDKNENVHYEERLNSDSRSPTINDRAGLVRGPDTTRE